MCKIPIINIPTPRTDIAYNILRGFPQKTALEHFQSPAQAKTNLNKTSLVFVAESKIDV